ncbi:GNAT family N-acetyltransferase [Cellulomonas sp. 179-A 9B4 NHS]|uniref:GNAT family N-acetyltransferase n=1 Tax=Cellulomonas sp. 179-A 9B4 NHS TaxID=3142379 RepID=UPI00399FF448
MTVPHATTTATAGPVRVRRAGPADVDAVGRLVAGVYVGEGLVDPASPYVAELGDAARRVRQADVLVATLAGPDGTEEVVGTLTSAPAGSPFAEIARDGEVELRMLAVHPGVRGTGLAAELVRTALAEAAGAGARGVVLTTKVEMRVAQRLYERLGMVRTPERDWAIGHMPMLVYTWSVPAAPGALVEAATWPPLRVERVGSWRVGTSDGFTQRGSSVLPLGAPDDLPAAVDAVEALYAAAGAPAVFRVGDPGAAPGLAAELDARGYVTSSVTDVLVRDLTGRRRAVPVAGEDVSGGAVLAGGLALRVADAPDDAWLDTWVGLKGGPKGTGRRLLTGAPALYLTATAPDGTPVGVVRVALADGWAALSCLQVVPGGRRRGVGRALTVAALEVAAARGATRAFLQVEADNAAARALYAGLGFAPAHRYAYRRQPGGTVGGC